MELDLSYLQAQPIFTVQHRRILLILAGTGGTGSFLARHVVRIAWHLKTLYEKDVEVVFIDPDVVERKNVLRQDFCEAEIGLAKAQTLALRYTAAFGIEILPLVERFQAERIDTLRSPWNTLTVIVGAVDNAQARKDIAASLSHDERETPPTWWIDCGNSGNGRDAGQVLIGNCTTREALADAFKLPGYCRKLPTPGLQHPELFVPLPEELADHTLSCAEMLAANAQSMMINQMIASHAAEMLYELVIQQKLRRYATYVDLPSGTTTSRYITQANIAKVLGVNAEEFFAAPRLPSEQHEEEEDDDEDEEFDEEEEEDGGV